MASVEYILQLFGESKARTLAVLRKHAGPEQAERLDYIDAARTGSAPHKALLHSALLCELVGILAGVVDEQAARIEALEAAVNGRKAA